ncbi:unnamed protein product, partial [marine sediment metagenome]
VRFGVKMLHKWNKILSDEDIDINKLKHLCKQAACSFIDNAFYNKYYEKEYIDLLCDISLCEKDDQATIVASNSLFWIIEKLCDDYQDFQFDIYSKVMTQIISKCRLHYKGEALNKNLNDKNIFNSFDLSNQAHEAHFKIYKFEQNNTARKIFILSRITLGADVAITSVIMQHMENKFPESEIVIIGPLKLKEIFEGKSNIKIRSLNYYKHEGLIGKINKWIEAADIIEEESA